MKGFFIQYKFIIPASIKHNSYTYQKLFRAIYGYTQNVTKSNGKTYTYHRKGVLSNFPHIRPGKNCVVIPTSAFNQLTTFFKTGKNPAHYWKIKGDWKAVFYMDEKNISERDAVSALERNLEETYVSSTEKGHSSILSEIAILLESKKNNAKLNTTYSNELISHAERICQNDWFKEFYQKSAKLSDFFKKYKELKS